MGMFGTPGLPKGAQPTPPAAHPPTLGSNAVAMIGMNAAERSRAAEGMGFDNTVLTTPQGLTQKVDTAPTYLGK